MAETITSEETFPKSVHRRDDVEAEAEMRKRVDDLIVSHEIRDSGDAWVLVTVMKIPASPSEARETPGGAAAPVAGGASAPVAPSASDHLVLGKNETFRGPILKGAVRCGLDPTALACLIDAEAAKTAEGVWNPLSKNPGSSAAGLTQFLDATWIALAEQERTLLNEVAKARGFVDHANRVVSSKRAELLNLRFDAESSIVAAGEYAKNNLAFLASKGFVNPSTTDDEKARLAYLAHHEGPSGAVQFLTRSIAEDRAEGLLKTNVGPAKAAELRGQHGTWSAAYIVFLNDYMDKKIQPNKFRA